MNSDEIINKIKTEGNSHKAPIHKKYHKSDLQFYGWDTPDLRKLAGQIIREIQSADELFIFSAHLWIQNIWDARMLVDFTLARGIKYFSEEDFTRFYKWFRDCDGWAMTDMLAYPVLGEFLRIFPQFHPEVDKWKDDAHMWVRRAGLIRFITPVRRKDPWPNRMEAVLIHHMPETDFFIRKAIGWVLREWAKSEPEKIRIFAEKHKQEMSPLSYREAVRNLI